MDRVARSIQETVTGYRLKLDSLARQGNYSGAIKITTDIAFEAANFAEIIRGGIQILASMTNGRRSVYRGEPSGCGLRYRDGECD
jgi:hypothetical protein